MSSIQQSKNKLEIIAHDLWQSRLSCVLAAMRNGERDRPGRRVRRPRRTLFRCALRPIPASPRAHPRVWQIFLFLPVFYLLSSAIAAAQPTLLWKMPFPGGYSDDATPAIAPSGMVYQPMFSGALLAITPDGKVVWQFKAALEIESSPAIGADGTIYFGSRDRKFYALTPAGQLKWTFETGAWNDSSPAIAADGTIYFGSWDSVFYALHPDGSVKWKFATGGIINSSPAIAADGTIYFGSHDKKFYALTPDGKLKWSFATGGSIISSPAIGSNGDIYFTSTDGNLYALSPDGAKLWQLHTGGASSSSPVLDGNGTIYVGANEFAFAVGADGKKLWEQRVGRSPGAWVEGAPVVTDSGIYFTSRDTCISELTTNGTVAWYDALNWSNASPTVGKNGVIYVACFGRLNAFMPTNAAPLAKSSWPMFRANREHTGRL